MASHGIKDRVAIVGMGCTPFKEHWDKSLDDMALEASNDAFAAAGITKDDVDAYWFGTAQSAMSGIPLARALQLQGKPVTRVENYCAAPVELGPDGLPARSSHGGYDLKSVRAAAQRYGGTLTLHWENNWFTLRVLLPIPPA